MSRKSKIDLLVRVRYLNPLPPPPCPPKLLEISTDPMRYAKPDFLTAIADDSHLPMIVDAECGMPLDLGKWECLWEEDADDSALNPDPHNLPKLDPKDEFLLSDPSSSSNNHANGSFSTASTATSSLPAHVSWLRKTEYISREGVSRSMMSQESKQLMQSSADVSISAQIRDIEQLFADANDNFDMKTLRHPTRPNVTAVESYEVLPDIDIWSNAYDLFRFSERPGERSIDVEDLRLDCAVLRPMESDGDHFLAYYLTKDDESASAFKEARRRGFSDDAETSESTAFHFVRDYETVKVEQEVPHEFLLVLNDGGSEPSSSSHRVKGAYYKKIERKMMLKKRRVNMNEAYHDKWETVNLSHVAMDQAEDEERIEALAEVVDPLYLRRQEADADGEVVDENGDVSMNNVESIDSGEVHVKVDET